MLQIFFNCSCYALHSTALQWVEFIICLLLKIARRYCSISFNMEMIKSVYYFITSRNTKCLLKTSHAYFHKSCNARPNKPYHFCRRFIIQNLEYFSFNSYFKFVNDIVKWHKVGKWLRYSYSSLSWSHILMHKVFYKYVWYIVLLRKETQKTLIRLPKNCHQNRGSWNDFSHLPKWFSRGEKLHSLSLTLRFYTFVPCHSFWVAAKY